MARKVANASSRETETENKENLTGEKRTPVTRAKVPDLIKNVIVTRRKWKTLKEAESSVVDSVQKKLLMKDAPWKDDKPSSPGAESTCTQTSTSTLCSVVRRQVESDTWVQCESTECLKWRRVPREEINSWGQGAPWYCFLNRDSKSNTCADPQEDFTAFERTVRKCKMKYVLSALPSGSLVWARIPGYCSWPAIVSPDPSTKEAIIEDYDGEPLSYHVEFLGKKHSHSWVSSSFVERYRRPPEEGETSPVRATELKGKQKRKRCENHVEAAVEEANALLDTLAHDRLDKCHYKPAGKVAADEDDVDVDVEEDDEEEEPEEDFDIKNDSDSSEDEEEDVGEKRKRGRPRLYPDGFVAHQRRQRELARQEKEVKREATQQADKQTNNSYSDTPKPKRGPGRPRRIETESSSVTKKASTPEHRQSSVVLPKKLADDYVDPSEVLQKEEKVGGVVKRKRRVMDVNYDDDDLMSKDSGEEEEEEEELQPQKKRVMCTPVRPQQDSKFLERMEARMLVGSPGWLRNHGHRTFNDSNMSLREKFIEDTRLYAENKKKFERDLRGFMSQHGKMIQKPPVWHGVGLNLFQLFMAVHDLGGSHKVSFSKKWLGMYREIFGPASSKVQTAHGLKTYYMKNILPYELYLNGEDYEEALEGARDLKSNSGVSLADSDESDCDDDDDEGSYMNDQASTISSSTQELMSELQVQASQASAYDILKEKVDMESSKMDLNIMFYDDLMAHQLSDPAFVAIQTTASEGELADMPDQTGGVPLDTLEMEATSAEPSSYVPEDDVMYELQVMGDPDTMSVEIEQSDLEAFAAGLKEAGFEEFEGKEEEKEQEVVEDEYEDEEDETEEMGGEEEQEQEEEVEENVVQVGVEEALQYQQSMEMLTNLVGLDFDQL